MYSYRVRQVAEMFVLEFRDTEYLGDTWYIIRNMYSWDEARGCAVLHNCEII
jgi:hypothetical protein